GLARVRLAAASGAATPGPGQRGKRKRKRVSFCDVVRSAFSGVTLAKPFAIASTSVVGSASVDRQVLPSASAGGKGGSDRLLAPHRAGDRVARPLPRTPRRSHPDAARPPARAVWKVDVDPQRRAHPEARREFGADAAAQAEAPPQLPYVAGGGVVGPAPA